MRNAWIAMAALAIGCGSDEIDAPDDCAADEMHLVYGSVDERLMLMNHAFINKIGSGPGTLDITGSTNASAIFHLEFNKLAANGDIVDARGRIQTTTSGLDVGNCASDGFPGKLHIVSSGVWRWELTGLHEDPEPDCAGAAVATTLSGCYRAE